MRYSVSCTIVELDDEGEIIENGYDGDVQFDIEIKADPVRFLLDTLTPLPETSGFCT